jgi:ribosomal protein S18 acetylase RimI-like enzyme
MTIRPTTPADLPGLGHILDETGLFPSDMLPALLEGFLAGSPGTLCLTAEEGGNPVAFCYSTSEALADRTWNLLAIAVLPAAQGQGYGSALCKALESALAEQGQRLLIVDTSGTDPYRRTRAFYLRNGYTEEARIRDFWAEGDDKVTFRKPLG